MEIRASQKATTREIPVVIPVYKPFLNGNEKAYVNECLESQWIAKGSFNARFEKEFADYVGVNFAATVCNGTAALHLALLALGLGPGDEVIVPTLTYVAPINMIALTGATPVLADSLRESWQMDPEDVRRKISGRTKAVLAVHLYGQPCDLRELKALCRDRRLFLIEDCAEAFGAKVGSDHVGTFGDLGTFSFFGNKTITTGEGGMVVTDNEGLIERVSYLRGQAVSPVREYWHDELGFNYRMNNICAAIGLAQLEQADPILLKKRQVAQWYRKKLATVPLELHSEMAGTTHSFWMCSAMAEDRATRDELRAHLRARGIETRPVFHPAHTMPVFKTSHRFPIAERIAECGFNLPSYPGLSERLVDYVCLVIKEFYVNQTVKQYEVVGSTATSA